MTALADDLAASDEYEALKAPHRAGADKAQPLELFDPRRLQGLAVPERRWIVPGLIPSGTVTLLYGDGGTGKSLLGQMLLTSAATGKPWLGQSVEPCKAIGFFCEDPQEELIRRQADINRAYNLEFSDLSDLRWLSLVGEDATLFKVESAYKTGLTDLYGRVERAAKAFGARLIIIDTAADVFDGDEISRRQVRAFIKSLERLAMGIDGAVLLMAHPSRDGISSGRGDGGSTGWSNSVRSRLSLEREKANDGAANKRTLFRKKANYASIDDKIEMHWRDGCFFPNVVMGGTLGAIERRQVESVFMDLIRRFTRQNRPVSAGKTSGNFAPKLFAETPEAEGYTKKDFIKAMEKLFRDGKIINEEYGRPGDKRRRIVEVLPASGQQTGVAAVQSGSA